MEPGTVRIRDIQLGKRAFYLPRNSQLFEIHQVANNGNHFNLVRSSHRLQRIARHASRERIFILLWAA
jgi:hypothetical protein